MNKTNHHIYKAEQIDWEETYVMSIKIKTPVFSLTMDATLSLIEDENGNPVISVNGINPSGE